MCDESHPNSNNESKTPLMDYYKLLHKRHTKLMIYFQKREDKIFYLTFLILSIMVITGGTATLFNMLLPKVILIASVVLLTWAAIHFIQENSIYKNELNDKVLEIEEKIAQKIGSTEGVLKGYNNLEFWKEDLYIFILKGSASVAAILVLFF